MIEAIVGIFAALVQGLVSAGEDKAKQDEAFMVAQEKLYRARLKARFG